MVTSWSGRRGPDGWCMYACTVWYVCMLACIRMRTALYCTVLYCAVLYVRAVHSFLILRCRWRCFATFLETPAAPCGCDRRRRVTLRVPTAATDIGERWVNGG